MRSIGMRMMLALVPAMMSVATADAGAATINLHDLGGVAGTKAERGFGIAAAYWGSVLTNNVTIDLGIKFDALGDRSIGGAESELTPYGVRDWATGVQFSRSGSQIDQTAILPSLNGFGEASFITNGVGANGNDDTTLLKFAPGNLRSTGNLWLNTAVIKAIWGSNNSGRTVLDGKITFNNKLAFDYDPSNGIAADHQDFIGVAIHEIGHVLGFRSGIDIMDNYGYPNGSSAGTLNDSVNNFAIYSALDMFRFSRDPQDLVPGSDPVLDLSVATNSYFSIDGGATALFGNSFATGRYHGDGRQASHWKNAEGINLCGTQMGMMDPTSCNGQMTEVTALDLAAFDAIGWNVAFDVLATPSYRMSSADIYAAFGASAIPEPANWMTMILGFGLIGGTMRHRMLRVRPATA